MRLDCTLVGSKWCRSSSATLARPLHVHKSGCDKLHVMEYAEQFDHHEAVDLFTMELHCSISRCLARKTLYFELTARGGGGGGFAPARKISTN